MQLNQQPPPTGYKANEMSFQGLQTKPKFDTIVQQYRQNSLENSQDRRFNLNLHSQEGSIKKSSDKVSLVNQDYNFMIGQPPTQIDISQANIQQMGQKPSHKKINIIGSKGLMIPAALKNHQEHLQQYQSIPVTRTRKELTSQAQQHQLKSFQRQTQVLMKMYGSSANANRKYVKSVERKIPLDLNNRNILQAQNQPLNSQSNSKLSNSYQMNPLVTDYARKSSGGNLNNSILSAINIYDSIQNTTGSSENLRFKSKRNFNQSNALDKYQLYTLNFNDQSLRKSSQGKKISLKNLRDRYNNAVNQGTNSKTIKPLEELRNTFNIGSSNNTKHVLNQNLLIQQNDAYHDSDFNTSSLNDSSKKRITQKYQTFQNLSHSTIGMGGGGGSSRRIQGRFYPDYLQSLNQQLENDKASTDTVMFLKQQELINSSQKQFEEGKQKLMEKDYKEAIKQFTGSLKLYPGNKDSKYYRAICYLDTDNPKKCIADLTEIVNMDHNYNKTVYIVLSIAHRRDNDLQNALKAEFRNFQSYIGQADSLKGLGNFKAALQSYNQAIAIDMNCRDQGLTKRGILLYQLKNYDQSLQDFNMLLEQDDKNARAHFYKGKILKNKGQENEGVLHFEQAIKNCSLGDDQLSGNSLFEISKIRIKQKDFYEAFHNLQRAVHHDFKSIKFLQYKMFVEGVLFIMKRKVKKGIKLLSSLVEGQITFDAKEGMNSSSPIQMSNNNNKSQLNDTITMKSSNQNQSESEQALKPSIIYLIYTYRSYGYIITKQLDKALSDLNKASKIKKLESACVYNRYIAQALLKMEKKDLNGVQQILFQAEQKFQNNKDPYKFQAISIIQGCISEMVDIDNPKQNHICQYVYNQKEKVNARCEDAAIDLDEEPSAKLYLARGRCHACLSMFQEAINDLTKAVEMDEELSDKNPMVHIYAGNLLMTTGSYDDATKAFTNADSVQKSALAFYQRSRCFIALANLDQALKDLNLVVERSPQDKIAYVDRECLSALQIAIQAAQSNQAPPQALPSPIAKSSYDVSAFEKGIVSFTKLLNTHYDIEYNTQTTTSANRMHQQIIPNVKRIKIEKMRALRRKRAKDAQINNSMKRTKKIKQRFLLEDASDHQLQMQASQIEPFSYYKENIFGQEDFYLYRGVMHFYTGDYQKAINDFEQSIRSKKELKDKENGSSEENENQSQSSNQTDLSDVGLCSLNVHEAQFNILLCLILMKNHKTALEKVNQLLQESPKKYMKNFYLIRGLLYSALGNANKSTLDLDLYKKGDQSNYLELLQNKQSISVNPFPIGSRVCSLFPEVKIQIMTQLPGQINPQITFYSRPSFSFPFVKPPNMIPNVDECVLTQEFDMKHVPPPKPEAPWIKRCDYGIKFTDEIQVVDESTAMLTETEDESKMDNQDEKDNQENGDSSDYSQSPFRDQQRAQAQNQQPQELNERYYLRNYIKEHRAKIHKAVSGQILKNEFNFFREMEEEGMNKMDEEMMDQDNSDEEDEFAAEQEQERQDIQDQLRQHLYGEVDVSNDETKNIIVDNEIDEDIIL
ncbi:tpr domain containing protein [Stylonychia lemnae]|uniref:Tpr domain containing protein n=1 Tax=Stylonychia lemnae TaxID=5949 RepID=A0A078A4A8_STYLE|nr:tpr domain containing protein [Stylonychia lemnae]|eukprot:CDW75599.1 tpr domain containing protein [Stylonychia lemnae]